MKILIKDISILYTTILKKISVNCTSIIIFASLDVDSVCALKIFTKILKSEQVLFKIYPVSTHTQLNQKIEDSRSSQKARSFFFLNCGGILDLTEKWFIKELSDSEVYLCDVHKPIHYNNIDHPRIYFIDDGHSDLDNFITKHEVETLEALKDQQLEDSDNEDYDSDQVEEEVAMEAREGNEAEAQEGQIGENDKEPKEEEQKSENKSNHNLMVEDEESSEVVINRGKRNNEYRRQIQQKKKRKKTLEKKWRDCYGSTYSSVPSSYIIYRLSRDIQKANNDYLWMGIVGFTSMYVETKLSDDVYSELFGTFLTDVRRLNALSSTNTGTIYVQNDWRFQLLRHWTLYDSILYSPFMVMNLRLWDDRGRKRLNQLLTSVGISLESAKQLFKYLTRDQLRELSEKLPVKSSEYEIPPIQFESFSRQIDSNYSITAADMACVLSTALQKPEKENPTKQEIIDNRVANFWFAYDMLQKVSLQEIDNCIQNAKIFRKLMMIQAQSLIEKKMLTRCNKFLLAKVRNEGGEKKMFEHPYSLIQLGKCLMGIYHAMKTSKSNRDKKVVPLIIAIASSNANECLVAGINPDVKNPFGVKFNQVAEENNCRARQDSFQANVITLSNQDYSKFFSKLNLRY